MHAFDIFAVNPLQGEPITLKIGKSATHSISPQNTPENCPGETAISSPDPIACEFLDCESPIDEAQCNYDEVAQYPTIDEPSPTIDDELLAINPAIQFPIPPDEVCEISQDAKPGDKFTIAWSFDCTSNLNVSRGTVRSVQRRAHKRKLRIEYEGIQGHQVGKIFTGHIPPHVNVRIFKITWDTKANENLHEKRSSTPNMKMGPTYHTEADLDLEPMPTLRSISPEFVPCVVAIYRDILRDYAESLYPQRNKIWSKILSTMKHSLATIRKVSAKRRRRRPLTPSQSQDFEENRNVQQDNRAIKKSTSLVLDGCVKKASRVIEVYDTKFRRDYFMLPPSGEPCI